MFVPSKSKTVIINNYFHIDLTKNNLDYFYGANIIKAIATVFGIENNKVWVSAAPYNFIYSRTIVFRAPLITYKDSNVAIITLFLHLTLSYYLMGLELPSKLQDNIQEWKLVR